MDTGERGGTDGGTGNTAGAATTVSAALRDAVAVLTRAGVPSAPHDARELMATALDAVTSSHAPDAPDGPDDLPRRVTATDLILHADDPVPASFPSMVARRAAREPLQFITGSAPVVGVDLRVGPGVFIPRPETDLLIDWGARTLLRRDTWRRTDALRRSLVPARYTVVDFCSGPGTVSLGLAHLLSRAGLPDRAAVRIVGIERNPTALEYARLNLTRWRRRGDIDVRVDVEFFRGDATDPQLVTALGLVAGADLVLANPPYVPEGDHGQNVAAADPEVAADPPDAVYSGADGLGVMRPLAGVISLTCAPHSRLAVEHDDSTGAEVRRLLEDAGIRDTVQHRDFAGRDRFVSGAVDRDPGFRLTEQAAQRLQ